MKIAKKTAAFLLVLFLGIQCMPLTALAADGTLSFSDPTAKAGETIEVTVKINTADKPSTALCEQIETVYKGRIGKYIGQITDTEQKCLDKALAVSIGIGLNLKGAKFVETWSKMYAEEDSNTVMTDALKKAIPAVENMENEPAKEHTPEEIIRIEAERDVYKGMYNELLGYLTVGRETIRA